MKISLITVVYNGEKFLQQCFDSVIAQTYPDIEYLVIDGGSTDKTLSIIQKYRSNIDYFVSEADRGLYDAINKGIEQATGDVIGILNADDLFDNPNVLDAIAQAFIMRPEIEGLYGDLNYIDPQTGKIIRKWKSKQANAEDLECGWMPAHPTLYLRKGLFGKLGTYALDLGTTADYDLMLRYLYAHKINALYLPILMVNMRMGGLSNRSIAARYSALLNDYKSLKRNKVPNPLIALLRKKMSKLGQF
ncbi:glycosyltransferase family 2 protein [Pedobacter sp. GSP4]|uniref:glycosyltransferase family 2 protein n=1 Tax=Pedobacter sp. GSP4 TaxID=3453716 RepID=UPI003EE94745